MKNRMLAGVIALCLMVVSGCSIPLKDNKDAEENPAALEQPMKDEKPQIKNVLTLAMYDFDTFQPLSTKSQSVRNCMKLVYEPLFDVDSQMKSVPVLATGYELSQDGKTVTVGIKSGVKFHDGSALTAKDVEYSTDMATSDGSVYKDDLSVITSCGVSGDRIVFKLSRPVPDFGTLLTYPIVKNKTSPNSDNSYLPVGTGPYYYGGKKTVDSTAFYRFEGWHNGSVNIDEVEIYNVSSKDEALKMFETGEIDVITSDEADMSNYAVKGNVKIKDYVTNDLTYLGFNFYTSYLWGTNTRQALVQAVNKQDIVASVLYGKGYAVTYPVNPSSIYYFDTDEKTSGNMDYAMELLAKDGWIHDGSKWQRNLNDQTEVLKLRLLVNSDSEEKMEIAKKIASAYNELGVDIKIDQQTYDNYVSKIQSKDFDLYIGEADLKNNQDAFELVYSGQNYFTYSNPEMDSVIYNMGATVDEPLLKQLFISYGNMVYNDAAFMPIFYRKSSVLWGVKIQSETLPTISNPFYGIENWKVG